MITALRAFQLPPTMTARPVRSCSVDEVGCLHDTVEISGGGPSGFAQSLAQSSAYTAVNAGFAGGSSCFASCIDCWSHVCYCTKEAGHSGKHTCPEGHGWY